MSLVLPSPPPYCCRSIACAPLACAPPSHVRAFVSVTTICHNFNDRADTGHKRLLCPVSRPVLSRKDHTKRCQRYMLMCNPKLMRTCKSIPSMPGLLPTLLCPQWVINVVDLRVVIALSRRSDAETDTIICNFERGYLE